MEADVVIVGAGMAGLYAAWRLASAGTGGRILLFEASDRLGGRVHSVRPPSGEAPAVELGAQTICGNHRLSLRLLKDMRIAVQPVEQEADGLIHLRGRTRSRSEIRKARFRRPFDYRVGVSEQRRGWDRLLQRAQDDPRGKSAVGLPERLARTLSADQVAYLSDRSGYGFWRSCGDADAVFDWAAEALLRNGRQLFTVPDGLSSLVGRLADAARTLGVGIVTGHRLASLERKGDGRLALGFEAGGQARVTVHAARAVLALPRLALGAIEGFGGQAALRPLLDAVEPWPVITSAIVYGNTWWTAAGFRATTAITDLPLGMVRHFGAEPWREGAGAGALAMFCDGERAETWRRSFRPLPTGEWLGPDHPVTREMHRLVQAAYVPKLRSAVPTPLKAYLFDWAEPPHGAAFHLWAAGAKPEEAMLLAMQPLDGVPVHVCGEAWSGRQAWMEGALETAESVLGRHFGLPAFLAGDEARADGKPAAEVTGGGFG